MLPIVIPAILDIAGKIFDRVIPDKAAAQKVKDEFAAVSQSQEFQIALAQIAVNAEEAKSPSLWTSGWRPFVGWAGATGFAYATIVEPIARFVATVAFGYGGAFPVLELGLLLTTLGGLLGLGTLRTVEKVKGAEANR